jgi:hypothetical protein
LQDKKLSSFHKTMCEHKKFIKHNKSKSIFNKIQQPKMNHKLHSSITHLSTDKPLSEETLGIVNKMADMASKIENL